MSKPTYYCTPPPNPPVHAGRSRTCSARSCLRGRSSRRPKTSSSPTCSATGARGVHMHADRIGWGMQAGRLRVRERSARGGSARGPPLQDRITRDSETHNKRTTRARAHQHKPTPPPTTQSTPTKRHKPKLGTPTPPCTTTPRACASAARSWRRATGSRRAWAASRRRCSSSTRSTTRERCKGGGTRAVQGQSSVRSQLMPRVRATAVGLCYSACLQLFKGQRARAAQNTHHRRTDNKPSHQHLPKSHQHLPKTQRQNNKHTPKTA